MRTVGSNAEETSRRVRDAAVRLFARQGYAATGIRELAEEAELTTAALYHYMGSKEDLLVGIMDSCLVPLLASAKEILAEDGPPEVRLATLAEMHVWLHATRQMEALVADSEVRSLDSQAEAIVAARDEYESLWAKLVAEGAAARRFHVDDERVATIAMVEMCSAVAHWYSPDGRLDRAQLCYLHADLALAMVRAKVDGEPVSRAGMTLPPPGERTTLHLG